MSHNDALVLVSDVDFAVRESTAPSSRPLLLGRALDTNQTIVDAATAGWWSKVSDDATVLIAESLDTVGAGVVVAGLNHLASARARDYDADVAQIVDAIRREVGA